MTRYEKPADQSENAKKRRAEMGQTIYNNNVDIAASEPGSNDISACVTALEHALDDLKKALDM